MQCGKMFKSLNTSGREIEIVNHFRHQGVFLDSKLTLKKHVDYIQKSSSNQIRRSAI